MRAASDRESAARRRWSQLAGQPLISYPVRAIVEAGLEPFVIAKAATELPEMDARVVQDEPKDHHPLYGVIAALRVARGRPVLVIACDMPLVSAELLAWLAGLSTTAIVRLAASCSPCSGAMKLRPSRL